MTFPNARDCEHGHQRGKCPHCDLAECETYRDTIIGQRQDQAVEIEKLKAAMRGLLKYHQEGDDGAELPREYWSPGYREAVECAEALVGPNVQGNRLAAGGEDKEGDKRMSNDNAETKAACGESLLTAELERQRFEEWAGGSIGRIWRKTEPGYTNEYEDSHTQIAWMAWINAVQKEREACAQIVDVKQGVEAWEIHGGQETIDVLRDLADAIRK